MVAMFAGCISDNAPNNVSTNVSIENNISTNATIDNVTLVANICNYIYFLSIANVTSHPDYQEVVSSKTLYLDIYNNMSKIPFNESVCHD